MGRVREWEESVISEDQGLEITSDWISVQFFHALKPKV